MLVLRRLNRFELITTDSEFVVIGSWLIETWSL